MSRKKQAALPVPTSPDSARELTAEYVEAERQIARARLTAEQAIDAVKAERDALIAIYAEPNAQRFAALKAWWEAGGKAVAGKCRSAELAGAVLGIRLTPQAVKLGKGVKVNAVIAWLLQRAAINFLRIKTELDKPAIIKACNASLADRMLFESQGVTIVQTDEFFIDCTIAELPIAREVEG
ncbi:MAG: host-nuclease inhibitor Gam family protein [Novosphingobium sp.]|uniref:host-nuclease inhibitor Gam family protein n=1 Tax=Novosphingobium sp. TaxID=1874826 RepID=UPI0032BE5371